MPVTYRELNPPPALADHVAAVWVRGGTRNGGPPLRVVPDGSADIIWREDGRSVTTVVAGPDTEAQLAPLTGGSRLVGVRFAPGAATEVLGVPLDALRDLRVPLGELWGTAAEELAERVATSDRPDLALATAVEQRITAPPDPTAAAIAHQLEFAAGAGVVAGLAADVGLSERQLQRRCRNAFGYGPKTLHRVLRFQRALRLARAGGRLADVAAVVGYADQAHLARETRRLAGVAITDLLADNGAPEPSNADVLEGGGEATGLVEVGGAREQENVVAPRVP
jgi:AraC-like DNA-binding protein